MGWSTHKKPISLEELGWINTTYLASTTPACDPMLVWGTTVETDGLSEYLKCYQQRTGVMLTTPHVLLAAVARALQLHPEFNRRVIGRKVHQYKSVNIVMPMLNTRSGEVDSIFLKSVHTMTLKDLAETLWEQARQKSFDFARERRLRTETASWSDWNRKLWKKLTLSWILHMSRVGFYFANLFRFPTVWPWQQELNEAGAFVNYLGFSGAPPLLVHKPAALPLNSYSILVTMGRSEPTPVVDQNQVVIRQQARLFVRVDHRMVNGNQTGCFVETLRSLIADPAQLESIEDEELPQAA